MDDRLEPVLIGPSRAGKSTLAPLLADALGMRLVKVDRLRWSYYERWGLSRADSARVGAEEGFAAQLRLWKPYEIRLVEAVFADHHDCVFDFGAGFTMFDDEKQAERLRLAMRPFKNVVLVLPAKDDEASIRLLWDRSPKYNPAIHKGEFFDFPRYEVLHSLPREVATHVLYTSERTARQCVDELVTRLVRKAGSERSE